MRMRGVSAVLAIGLSATLLAVPVAAQDQTQLCLTVTTGPGSGLGSPVMVRNGITSGLIEVVSVDECALDTGLDSLSDGEHYGVFLGHIAVLPPALEALAALRDDPRLVRAGGPVDTWLAELVADPDTLSFYLTTLEQMTAVAEAEVAWLETHPPRPCWAEAHAAMLGWYDQSAAMSRDFAAALRAEDAEMLLQALDDLKALDASAPAFERSFRAQTCLWVPG